MLVIFICLIVQKHTNYEQSKDLDETVTPLNYLTLSFLCMNEFNLIV